MEYTALYRKWRPNSFDEVVGQDHVIRILKNQVISGRITHAYLFSGPRGTGKTSTAKIFAKAINCESPRDGSPCEQCSPCRQIESENNLDIIEIDAASNTGVDHIREIRDKVKYPPTAGKYRVYIIDEVHMLSTSAFNAFLKTLEEPPDHAVFILATTEPHKLPTTVLSRCQRYDFRRITLKVIIERLKTIAEQMGIKAEEGALEAIARWSEGGMRDSISLLDQCVSFRGTTLEENDVFDILGTAGSEFLFEVIYNILEGDIPSLLIQIDRLIGEGRDIAVFIKDLISHLRNLLIVGICEDPTGLLDVTQSILEEYKRQAKRADEARLVRSIEILSQLDADIKWSTSPRIMLEMAIVKICRPWDGDAMDDVLDRLSYLEKQIARGITHMEIAPAGVGKVEKPESGETSTFGKAPQEFKGEKEQIITANPAAVSDNQEVKISDNEAVREVYKAKPQSPSKEPDVNKIWADILKIIKKDRMAIFTLLREAELRRAEGSKNIINLIFPEHQGFYVAAIEKEENSKYIEDLLTEKMGETFKLKCFTADSFQSSMPKDPTRQIYDNEKVGQLHDDREDNPSEKDNEIIQRAIDMFGEEYVEVIED